MTDIAIRVDNLSKLYRLGAVHQRPDTLRDALTGILPRIARISRNQKGNSPNSRHASQENSQNALNSRQASDSDDHWALKDVSFEVKRGEVVGIIGRNGAGKSTLLKILSRITEPTSGQAEIHGRVGSLLEVGTGFHPELTGRENIYLNGAILGMHRHEIQRRFDEIVAFAEIERFLDTPVKRYSSGMYVRLAFAVAAHLEPEILLVDEVLAVGDAAFQKKCLGKMGDVAKEGRTVLFVSHNMAAVNKLCPGSIWLEQGQVAIEGSSDKVIRSYLSKTPAKAQKEQAWGIDEEVLNSQTGVPVRIDTIKLVKPDGSAIEATGVKGGLKVCLLYETNRPVLVPGFIVMLRSQEGVELCRVSNMPISGYYIEKIDGRGSINVVFEKLWLTGGRYYLSIGVARASVEWLLRLDDVVWFDVAASDPYSSGVSMDTDRGYLILPHLWEHFPYEQVNEHYGE